MTNCPACHQSMWLQPSEQSLSYPLFCEPLQTRKSLCVWFVLSRVLRMLYMAVHHGGFVDTQGLV